MSNEDETPQNQEPEPSDETTTEESSSDGVVEEGADADSSVESEEINRPPFAIKAGARISYGQKKGSVISVRGNGKAPYEVGVRWAHDKHPEWMLFEMLKLAYEVGNLVINP